MNEYKPGDSGEYNSHEEMWDDKLDYAQYTGLYDSVGEHGVVKPVHVIHAGTPHAELIEGHHRVASQAAHDHDRLMPVMHHRSRAHAIVDWRSGKNIPGLGDIHGTVSL